jgi:predicted 2-oxoglutarate/Fe(II)-dependent dioxygenase YbiX
VPPFIAHGFFDRATCARIRAAMDAGTSEPTEVLAGEIMLDEEVRRAESVDVDEATLALVENRLDGLREQLAAFFGVPLTEREGTSLLRYPAGGFYRPHRDYGADGTWPGAARRQVAVVIFLNSSREQDPAGPFAGGCLRLWPDDEQAIDLWPQEGTVVAFRASMLHEVTVVAEGTRETLVDWFY